MSNTQQKELPPASDEVAMYAQRRFADTKAALAYEPPEDAQDFGERYDDHGNKVVLYFKLGESAATAIVDVLAVHEEDGEEVIDGLLWRAEPPTGEAVEALHHTQRFLPEAVARAIFGKRAV